MTKKCAWCGKLLETDSVYCTDKSTCRVAAWRVRRMENIFQEVDADSEIKVFKQR